VRPAVSALDANRLGVLWSTLDSMMGGVVQHYSPSSAAIVLTLRYWAPISVNDLAGIVGLSQPACSRAVAKLADEGLLKKERGGGKEIGLALSATGKRQAEALQRRRVAACARLLHVLSADEQASFNQIVDKLLSAPVSDRAYARHVCRFCDHEVCDGPRCPVGCAATALEATA
jgi:DNA-binding MarR family transcriptional regulator